MKFCCMRSVSQQGVVYLVEGMKINPIYVWRTSNKLKSFEIQLQHIISDISALNLIYDSLFPPSASQSCNILCMNISLSNI